MLNQEEVLFLKNNTDLWGKLTAAEQQLLLDNTVCRKYLPNSTLHSIAAECLGVIIVKSGQLRVFNVSESGREITLYRMNAGDICMLSAACVLDSIKLEVVVGAEQDSEIIVINPKVFADLLKDNVALENYCLKMAGVRMSQVVWTLEQILFMSMDRRLAQFLLEESEKNKEEVVRLTHEQIARYIGSAREVVSRMLKYFEQENLLKISRGSIAILNKQGLQSFLE